MQKYKKLLGSRMNPKRPTPKHTIEKLSKTKDMNLENSKRKLFYSLQGTASVRLSVDFSAQTLQVRRLSNNIFKVLIKKYCQQRILYLAKQSFKNEKEIKDIPR